MGLKTLLLSLLAIQAVPGRGHPHHSHKHIHKHHHLHEAHLNARDGGGQLFCPPIPDKLTTSADLIAKVRYTDRDTYSAKLEARSILTIRTDDPIIITDPNNPYSCSKEKPYSNGAYYSKTNIYNYSPKAYNINSKSPNDKC
ncbi:hypothetical protein CEP52_015768 [Fusarium oligoseptatum]|uniref:Uncharacterized protein n=1 Tax=Fusarium oligoseptatum TaxID=2604345 RepID=A0A428SA57_9HYPO|nr:hypothetical protein CEP52_015768 [Fusarium oligoseptatum]